MSVKKLLETAADRILLLDGAMGTMLQALSLNEEAFRGRRFVSHGYNLKGNNDILLLTNPDIIASIHDKYLLAGADIIKTATFNSNRSSQSDYGTEGLVYELNNKGAVIARQCADNFTKKNTKNPRFVAGVLGPTNRTLSISPDVNRPAYRAITFDELVSDYSLAAQGLLDGGVDLFLIETVFDTLNAKAAIYAILSLCEKKGLTVPIMVSGTVTDASGRVLSGQTVRAFLYSISHANPLSVGLNCALGTDAMYPHIKEIAAHSSFLVSMHPNAGMPDEFGHYNDTPDKMAASIKDFAKEGLLNIAGGCCGSTPEHIAAIAESLNSVLPRNQVHKKNHTFLSGLESLEIGNGSLFVNIGERTNVAGSAKFASLIREGLYEEATAVARQQVENGAQIIDVNMDEAMLDSEKAMAEFLNHIASEPAIARVPVMVDSSNWDTIRAGLKCLQGKGVVNSLSLKEGEESFVRKALEIKKMGAAVVVMAFDEQGQAETKSRKIEICVRAYRLLTNKCCYDPHDIIFDPNVFAIATGLEEHRKYGVDFIEAVAELKKLFPETLTSGGISNVSFSFRGNSPLREAIHTVFLYHAIKAGLSMGIVNAGQLGIYEEIPKDLREKIENAIFNLSIDASDKLLEVASTINGTGIKATAKEALWRDGAVEQKIVYALVNGIDKYIEEDSLTALKLFNVPLDIIEGPLMAGMREVGTLFGEGKMFLPQVIKSARVMKKAVATLTPYMKREDNSSHYQGTIVLATVKGDVHDIGKKIVEVVLQCNNFKVIDLGVMVPAQQIIETAIREQADIIGLSGLITPSLEEMISVAIEMKREKVDIPLLIGGATTSKRHTAVKIAPNANGPVIHVADASLAVPICQKLISKSTKNAFIKEISEEYKAIKKSYEATNTNTKTLPLAEANNRGPKTDWSKYQPEVPNKLGITYFNEYPLSILAKFINWSFVLKAWETPENSKEAEKLLVEAQKLLDTIIANKSLRANGAVGLFPAFSNNNFDIDIYARDTRTEKIGTIYCLRQQIDREDNKPLLSMADFVAPESSGVKDFVGVFAVTAGIGLENIVKAFERENNDFSAIMAKVLADRLAEAFAEKLHEIVRKELWGYAHDEALSLQDLFRVKYRGIRPAPGYPASPDHSEKKTIFDLLHINKECGITLTENWLMVPAASVCGYYFAHPFSSYFAVKNIGDDQLDSYAKRKGIDREIIRKAIAAI